MIWAQFRLNEDFTALANRVADVCQPHLLEQSKHYPQPIPHVTIARMKHVNSVIDLKSRVVLPHFVAQQAALWLSESGTKGAVYTPLATFYFSKSKN
jgi:2'-5' RNA ligase